MWCFIVSELAFIQNKQEEEASYPEQQQNKKKNSSRGAILNYYKGSALKAVNAYLLFIRGLVNDKYVRVSLPIIKQEAS